MSAAFPPAFAATALLYRVYADAGGRWSAGVILVPFAVGAMVSADTPAQAEFEMMLRMTNGVTAFAAVVGHWTLARIFWSGAANRSLLYIVGGTAFPYICFSLNHLGYFSGLWSAYAFARLGEPILLASWLIIWFGAKNDHREDTNVVLVRSGTRCRDGFGRNVAVPADKTSRSAERS